MGIKGMFDLEKQYAFYGAYHRRRVNVLMPTLLGWPLFFSFLVLFYFTPPICSLFFGAPPKCFLTSHGLLLNFGFFLALFYAVAYVCLDRKAGSLADLLCLAFRVGSSLLAQQLGFSLAWKFFLASQVICWAGQSIGHGVFEGVPEQKLRVHLGSFGLTGNLALQPMYTLSGGQKSRVAFAKITFEKPHMVFLDKPSNYLNQSAITATWRRKMTDDCMAYQAKTRLFINHLDLDAVEVLIQGLVFFQGGVLMVSHNEHLQAWMSSGWFLKARWHLSMGVSGIVRRYFSPHRVRWA